MKNTARLITISLMAISLGITGCKHGPQGLTSIQGKGPGIYDDTSKPIGNPNLGQGNTLPPGPGTGAVTPVNPVTPNPNGDGSIPPGPGHPGWGENPDEFAAQTVYFEFDKSTVRASEIPKLEEVARRMSAMPKTKALKVEGHCDERGTEEYNRALGDRRALSIREWFAGHGLSPDRVDVISYGEDKPADSAHNEAAWKKNRRGQLILLTAPGAN